MSQNKHRRDPLEIRWHRHSTAAAISGQVAVAKIIEGKWELRGFGEAICLASAQERQKEDARMKKAGAS
jgi:hypothetical protein